MTLSVFIGIFWLLLIVVVSSNRIVDLTIEKYVHFNNNSDEVIVEFGLMKVKKLNRTHQALDLSLTVLIDLDNDVEISIDVYKNQGNEYRKTAFRVPRTPYCDFVKSHQSFHDDVTAVSNIPPPGNCPALPKGNYTVQNYCIDASPIPDYFEGRYLLIFSYYYFGRPSDNGYFYGEIRHFY